MTAEKSPFIVSADWLEQRLGSPGLKIVDASWYLPVQKRDPKAEYDAGHIPGAVFFDHEGLSDPTSGLPHTLLSPIGFAGGVGALGLSEKDTIVVYDGPGLFSAPRVWWMLRIMGADTVYLLDGGFDAWKAEGRPVTADHTIIEIASFTPRFDEKAVIDFEAMREIVKDGSRQIADARSAGRFTGEEPEPRAGMRSGHMPGARSLPASSFADQGRLKPLSELRTIIEEAGIDLDKPVVTSCGSGITAAVITLALQSLGHKNNSLYDGSWSEWGSRPDTEIVTGKP